MQRHLGWGVLLALVLSAAPVLGAEPTKPRFDRVDYGKPKKALAPCRKFDSRRDADSIVTNLLLADSEVDISPVAQIQMVDSWIKANFTYDPNSAYKWRDLATMRKDKTYGGCADHAVLFGSLLRAADIPTVFVKTMDCDWIRAFVKGPRPATWSGHCFLEVYVDDKWMLLDASAMRLYRDYDTSMRILPGNRFAYDKGYDPYKMVKSMRWELWKKQTVAYFEDFDLTKLPVAGGIPVAKPPQRVFAAANSPYWKWLHERCESLGLSKGAYSSFKADFDKHLRKAGGHLLIITWVGDTLVLPEKHHATHLPGDRVRFEKILKKKPFDSALYTLWDGTRVVLLVARDKESMRKAIDAFEFP